jgi:hypothetical protein
MPCKRRTLETVSFLIFLCLPLAPAFAQDTQRVYAVATDFSAEGKVLELNLPVEMDGSLFIIAFQNASGAQRVFAAAARAGSHCYELRQFPEWQGTIKYIAINVAGIQGQVKEPALPDNIDIFLEPQRISPPTVNVLMPHTIFAWSWTAFLFFTFIVATVVFAVFKKRVVLAAVIGFVVAWALMDLRAIVDDATIIYKKEKYDRGMPPLTPIKTFSDQAANSIGNSTWGHGRIDPLSRSFLRYRLAEHPFAAPPQPAALWVTQNPAEGKETLLQVENFYLVRKEEP